MKAAGLRGYCALVPLFAETVHSFSLLPSSSSASQLLQRIVKRNTTVIPAPINVAASQYWDGNDGPWSSFPLDVGSGANAQEVRVMISTAGYTTWVVEPEGCPANASLTYNDCASDRGFLYYSGNSSSWVPNSIFDTGLEQNLDLDSTGFYGFDTVSLGWNAGGPTVEHSTIAKIADYKWWYGIFGLNPQSANFTTLNDPQPSFMSQLKNSSKIPSLAWAYTAGAKYRSTGVFGSLVLGGYDESRFTADSNLTFSFAEDVSRNLVVGVDNIEAVNNGSSYSLMGIDTGFYAFVDSTIPQMILPLAVCTAFEEVFGLTWNSTYELYLVNDTWHQQLLTSNPAVTFTLGTGVAGGNTVKITLPYGAFDKQVSYPIIGDETSYYFPLLRTNASFDERDPRITLGRTFLQEAYLMVDYERNNFTIAPCAWGNIGNSVIKAIYSPGTIFPSSGSSSLGAGAIAGVAIAIVAVIVILGLIFFFLRRKKKHAKKQRQIAELEANEQARKDAAVTEDSKPFITKGGELGGEQVHEVEAPFKMPPEMDTPPVQNPNKMGYNELDSEQGIEYFGKRGRYGAQEMQGDAPIYEMAGSEVLQPVKLQSRDQGGVRPI